MAETTHISWADSTLNIWFSCTKVSTGPKGACENCYAQHLVETRFGLAAWGPHAERVEAKGWRAQLRKISRMAKAAGRPWFVFVNSLSDFWDNQADPALRRAALTAFAQHPHVTFLLLTKRPQNIVSMVRRLVEDDLGPYADERGVRSWWPRNVAIGCTVVTQTEADRDIPVLLAAKAALNPAFAFVSMEPLMEAVDLTRINGGELLNYNALRGRGVRRRDLDIGLYEGPILDWVITGGETDQGAHKARPSHPAWFRSLRDQCAAAGVAFHFKQWGEWTLRGDWYEDHPVSLPVRWLSPTGWTDSPRGWNGSDEWVARVGKKAAGRALDGVVHDARPAITAESTHV